MVRDRANDQVRARFTDSEEEPPKMSSRPCFVRSCLFAGVVGGCCLLATLASCSKENNLTTSTVNNFSQEIHCEGPEMSNPECVAATGAPEGAVCVYGYCRSECTSDADCEAVVPGSICLPGMNASGCRLPSETDCAAKGCVAGLSCAPDGACRVDCSSDSNACLLAGLSCEDGVCVGTAGKADATTDASSEGCVGDCILEWAAWPMPNPVDAGLPNPASYKADTETVKDDVTGLIWQRMNPNQTFSWAAAKSYCADLTLGGSSDWRLPTAIELVSIVDFSKSNPSIDTVAFPTTKMGYYWTTSPVPGNPDRAFIVDFRFGPVSYFGVTTNQEVRCVR